MKVLLPLSSATIDGSASTESAGKALTFAWTQNYGPSTIQFSDATSAKPLISGLVEGMYSIKLTVSNPELRSDDDELLVMVSSLTNILPVVSLLSPADKSTVTAGNTIIIAANASDFDGSIQKVDFYQNDILISSDNEAPYTATWNPAAGNYILTAKAIDNGGAVGNSQVVNVTVAPKMSCTEESKIATQGAFSQGYICTYETVGTSVTVTFELLDTDKQGVVAYLWKQTPFSESPMVNVSGKIFAATLNGLNPGATISYACKFAYAGGMSVTKYISYVVGSNCGTVGVMTRPELKQTVYPNPVQKELHLQLLDQQNRLILMDMSGHTLSDNVVPANYTLDMSAYKTGIYLLRIENKHGIQYKKVIKN
jgi:hypothetical protein